MIPWGCVGMRGAPRRPPRCSGGVLRLTHLGGECCSESEPGGRAGGLVLRFTQAFSLGGGAGTALRGCFSSWGRAVGEGASSSLASGSFSRDFSLSLRRVAAGAQGRGRPGGGHAAVLGGVPRPSLSRYLLLPVGPVPAVGPGGPLCEDSLPVRDRSWFWFSSLRQLGCLRRGGGG